MVLYARRCVASSQAFGIGELHVTPTHGSTLHAPAEQPKVQWVS
jgi:hypothetical protein